jgi:hypothetical protein
VMKESMTSEPTSRPWAHASRMSSVGSVGFSTTLPRAITLETGLMVVAEIFENPGIRAEEAC